MVRLSIALKLLTKPGERAGSTDGPGASTRALPSWTTSGSGPMPYPRLATPTSRVPKPAGTTGGELAMIPCSSEKKSPPIPVVKVHERKTGRLIGPAAAALQAGVRSIVFTGCPRPDWTPASKVGTTQARYAVSGLSCREQISREMLWSGAFVRRSVAVALVLDVTCACAQKRDSPRSGSSLVSGRCRIATGLVALFGSSVAGPPASTTTRQIHGLSWTLPCPLSGVNIQGRSGRRNSTNGK